MLGLSIPLAIILISLLAYPKPMKTVDLPGFFNVFPVFRGTGLFFFYMWLFGLNLLGWTRNRINHVFLFGFNPMKHMSWVHAFKVCLLLMREEIGVGKSY